MLSFKPSQHSPISLESWQISIWTGSLTFPHCHPKEIHWQVAWACGSMPIFTGPEAPLRSHGAMGLCIERLLKVCMMWNRFVRWHFNDIFFRSESESFLNPFGMMHSSSEFEQRIDFYADPFSIGNLLTGFHAIVWFLFHSHSDTLCWGCWQWSVEAAKQPPLASPMTLHCWRFEPNVE